MPNLRWQIGEFGIFQIVEIEAGEVIQSIIPNATPDVIKKIPGLTPDFADDAGNLKAVVQCFLIKSGDKNILVDTCNGNQKRRPDMPEWGSIQTGFLTRFRETGIDLHQIDVVVCTHLHFDHIGWNTRLLDGRWIPTFPNAKYLFVRDEFNFWAKEPKNEIVSDLEAFQDSVRPIVEEGLSELVDANHKINEFIRLIPTPGHTEGHVCVNVESQNRRAIILGDLIYHPCQIINSKWTTESDQMFDKSIESRNKILDEVADTDTILLGAHFPNPVAVRVIRTSNGYDFTRVVSV